MGQFSKVLLAIDNAHTVTQRALDCRPGLIGLNQVYVPNLPQRSPTNTSYTTLSLIPQRSTINTCYTFISDTTELIYHHLLQISVSDFTEVTYQYLLHICL